MSAMTGVENLTAVSKRADSSRISKVEPRIFIRPYIILDFLFLRRDFMKLYISGNRDEFLLPNLSYTDQLDEADIVLILPGGLGTFACLFQAIQLNKKVLLYNQDLYFTSLIKNLYEGYQKGYIEKVPAEYMQIESEKEEIFKILEEM